MSFFTKTTNIFLQINNTYISSYKQQPTFLHINNNKPFLVGLPGHRTGWNSLAAGWRHVQSTSAGFLKNLWFYKSVVPHFLKNPNFRLEIPQLFPLKYIFKSRFYLEKLRIFLQKSQSFFKDSPQITVMAALDRDTEKHDQQHHATLFNKIYCCILNILLILHNNTKPEMGINIDLLLERAANTTVATQCWSLWHILSCHILNPIF